MKKILILFLLVLVPVGAFAASDQNPLSVGKIVFAKGDASVLRTEAGQVRSLTNITFNDDIYAMDTLVTKKGEMKVLFEDQTVLTLGENSKVIITEQVYKPRQGVRKSVFDIIKGKIRTVVEHIPNEKESDVMLRTPTAVAGIRGTDVGVIVDGKKVYFLCFDGLIETWFLGKPSEKVMVPKGQFTLIKNAPPTQPKPIDENMKKKFHLYYVIKDILDQDGMHYLALGRDPRWYAGRDGLQQGQGRYAGPSRQRLTESLLLSPILPGAQNSTPSDLGATAGGTTPITPITPPVDNPPPATPPSSPPSSPPPPPPPTDTPVHLPLGFPLPG